jgi:zinc/manganese transport system substrate-binding protein
MAIILDMRPRPATALVATLVAVLGVTACASADGERPTAATADCPVEPLRVVVSVDQWSGVVGPLAGPCGDVTTIVSGSSVDPHDFEPTPADSAAFARADLVVVNGLGYDAWAEKAVAAAGGDPSVVDAAAVTGRADGDNPHVWYAPDVVVKVAGAMTEALKALRPDGAASFDRWHAAFLASLRPYDAAIADVRTLAEGSTYGATESVFDEMAAAVGLRDVTPAGFRAAAANGSEPAPGDLHAFEQAIRSGAVHVLVVNPQTEGALPAQLRHLAEDAGVPVVEVTETMAPGAGSFVDWQVGQLRRLADALRSAG